MIGPTEIEVVANHGLEEFPAAEGTAEDLGETDFRLENRELIREAGRGMGRRQWERDVLLPARKEPVDRRGVQRITHLLEGVGPSAAEKAIVQRGEPDAAGVQLPLRPLVAIEADLDRVRLVAADLNKGRPGVEHVDVVVVGTDRFARVDKCHEASTGLLGCRPRRCAFLRDANQHHTARLSKPIPVALDDGVLAFTLSKFDPGNPLAISPGAEPCCKGVRDLPQDGGRRDLLSATADEKVDHSAATLQPGHVRVEVQPLDAARFQRDKACRRTEGRKRAHGAGNGSMGMSARGAARLRDRCIIGRQIGLRFGGQAYSGDINTDFLGLRESYVDVRDRRELSSQSLR